MDSTLIEYMQCSFEANEILSFKEHFVLSRALLLPTQETLFFEASGFAWIFSITLDPPYSESELIDLRLKLQAFECLSKDSPSLIMQQQMLIIRLIK